MKKELIIGIILGLIIGFIVGYLMINNCPSNSSIKDNGVEFTIDANNKMIFSTNAQKCYEDYKEKFGSYPNRECILKEAKSMGETEIGNAQFLTEYTCLCYN